MKTLKGKIIAKIALALAVVVAGSLVVIFVLPLDQKEDELNIIIGIISAVTILTVFSIFATIQEEKKGKKRIP